MPLGESVLVVVLRVLLNKLASQSILEFLSKWKIDILKLDKLRTLLNSVEVLLSDAEYRQFEENSNIRRWLEDVKFIFYDAEDFFDELAMGKMRLSNKVRYGSFNVAGSSDYTVKEKLLYKCKDIFRTLHPYKVTIEAKMDGIVERLQLAVSQKDFLGLKQTIGLTSYRKERLSTSLLNENSIIYGREVDKKEILSLLTSREGKDDALRVISIVGMGGLGKTTLARMVYGEYESPNEFFELRGWVCITDEFDVTRITKLLLESITGQRTGVDNNLELLQQELRSHLQGKRFLLVLDDLWNETYENWDVLQTPFSYGAFGSRILVTTRLENVSRIVCSSSDCIYRLNKLSKDDCWALCAGIAFKNGDSANQKLKAIGTKIISRSDGLPLAAKMLGGLFLSKGNSVIEWESILLSNVWTSANNKVLPTLWLSYYYLPMRVKQCFSYCSLFPKGYQFSMDQLVLLWMAEGLIEQSCEKITPEDVGRSYFYHLLSKSFFQKSCDKEMLFVMHDLIHDLAEYVSGDLCFRPNTKSRSRWFSYDYATSTIFSEFKHIQKSFQLRTFISYNCSNYDRGKYFDEKVLCHMLTDFRFLQVLSLKGYAITKMPDSLSGLKYLRYLDLSNTDIECLPSWITIMYNLQTLRLFQCKNLTRLPGDIVNLVNLRHLIFEGTQLESMPSEMRQLTRLQTLSNYVVAEGRSEGITDLGFLRTLQGRLHISGLNFVREIDHIVSAGICQKTHLDDLILDWEPGERRNVKMDIDVLNAVQPHRYLKKLTINFFGGLRLSRWIAGQSLLTNLEYLHISYCFNCLALQSLGTLPVLKHLVIEGLICLELKMKDFMETLILHFHPWYY